MKLSIERNTLLKAVSHAQSVVERRNTIPILANVLIEVTGTIKHLSHTRHFRRIPISNVLIKGTGTLKHRNHARH